MTDLKVPNPPAVTVSANEVAQEAKRKQALIDGGVASKRESISARNQLLFQRRATAANPSEPQVFIIVRRKKLTHYMTFGESATFQDVKNEIERCTQVQTQNMALYYSMNGELMGPSLTLYQSGFLGSRHPPTTPAVFYASFRQADGKFEQVEVADYLRPPAHGPHVIDGPGGADAVFPIADYAQKLLQQLSIKHNIRK